MKDFFVKKSNDIITFVNNGEATYPFLEMFLNGKYAGAFALRNELSVKLPQSENISNINVSGYALQAGALSRINKSFKLEEGQVAVNYRNPPNDFQAGDILVACDNVDGMPYGYMGHAALVVDTENIIESVVADPIIQKVPISQFTDHHPMYAHFRPKNKELGVQASSYAEAYLKKFKQNKSNGVNQPMFYFSVNTPLTDEWTYIYCSKLIWLSYHYGANYSMPLDHLWFSPEDLYTILSQSKDFDMLYKHPNYQFFVDL
ncbi:hypothetical protein [Bacillus sp. AK128]